MDETLSSRIFVKGLPPTFTEAQFRQHFARDGAVTDAKIFQNRRIGYIGYKTHEDAQKAVKYFNKTFIRMSRIGVEIARPPTQAVQPSAPTARREAPTTTENDVTTGAKRKRESEVKKADDPKLKEFLDAYKPKSKRKALGDEPMTTGQGEGEEWKGIAKGQSDGEYEAVPKKVKRAKNDKEVVVETTPETAAAPSSGPATETGAADGDDAATVSNSKPETTDADWARSRTSRLLGLLDEEEDEVVQRKDRAEDTDSEEEEPKVNDAANLHPARAKYLQTEIAHDPSTGKNDNEEMPTEEAAASLPSPPADEANTVPSNRLFVRNLPYTVQEDDLRAEFEAYGTLEEVHVCMDKLKKTGLGTGYAYVEYASPSDAASRALADKDGQTFQGRLLHIIPATAKRKTKLDEFELSKLPLKKQQEIKRKREQEFSWNAFYMSADAVVSSVADRFGLSKSEVLDPTSSDAAVKQAHAETHVIQETKSYFKQQGIDLEAFRDVKKSDRGDTAIVIKCIPYGTSKDELMRRFEEHGDVKRFLMPPNGIIAIVEMADATQGKTAWDKISLRVGSSMLKIEKAPKNLFNTIPTEAKTEDGVTKTSASDLKTADADYTVPDTAGTATLFVKNLNFATTTEQLTAAFKSLPGFLSARVNTKTDPKKPGQVLSMGFGFTEFASAPQAQAALKAMDGHTLEGHKLQIRASHKGTDAAEERRKADAAKRVAGKKTKIIVKNLPFEATKKDVRALFGAYGQLRSVRVPKKMDNGARGFGFADFTTPKEAQSAIEALKDTHLLGRRLVLDFAEGDPEDAEAEIEKMQKKVGGQVNKVALQKLTSGGRKKFMTAEEEE
ncbi:Multiple RNA-binding domain-containing protein 1 [Elasticomyces elasticus]|nr:Multiple RNA-binding domain-containing protein 1 [Elasticomyces elasticus]KAK3653454.1 Multiple RNA-binding domain-containing protein 1 [Elasticomyces elasticus]KAK4925998.1 Multiple RNA-binding domain-containing protein 1 [Elasticomyces elasticus]KAK5768234.1 Multiple RNA-binding domain-containing protein 1 [Elasticomyces elasticus]